MRRDFKLFEKMYEIAKANTRFVDWETKNLPNLEESLHSHILYERQWIDTCSFLEENNIFYY